MLSVKRVRSGLPIFLIPIALVTVCVQTESKAMSDAKTEEALTLMNNFAWRTGLTSDRPKRRYLWTDAFAVCNFLGLAHTTGDRRYTDLALRLVDQVHHTLGQHRDDDPRHGWLSGLSEREGEFHPTLGGLRIGKSLPERGVDEPFDEQLEWDRDGQYFHYLTQWIHALDQVSRSTGESKFNVWARELAKTAYQAFTYQPSAGRVPSMYWKMSIDLSRPLVPSMGQHDPLDGYITAMQLRAMAAGLPQPVDGPDLEMAIRQFSEMTERIELASPDPLGMGGLLIDAYRVSQLMRQGKMSDEPLLERLLSAALSGLRYYSTTNQLQEAAEYRLAFRELGLAIGLQAVERMQLAGKSTTPIAPRVRTRLEALMRYVPLGKTIESYWRGLSHQSTSTWAEHRDINEVMLATCLAPDGFLVLTPPK
jgi:hypothetical protein